MMMMIQARLHPSCDSYLATEGMRGKTSPASSTQSMTGAGSPLATQSWGKQINLSVKFKSVQPQLSSFQKKYLQADHGGQWLQFVLYNVVVSMSGGFCLGSYKLGRNCRAVGQQQRTSIIKSTKCSCRPSWSPCSLGMNEQWADSGGSGRQRLPRIYE